MPFRLCAFDRLERLARAAVVSVLGRVPPLLGYTLLHNEHIRIDVVAANLSRRKQIWIDIFGTLFFLLPIAVYMMWSSWPIFMNAWTAARFRAAPAA